MKSKERKSKIKSVCFFIFFYCFCGYSQSKNVIYQQNNDDIENTHLLTMLNFLVFNNFYNEKQIEDAYANYLNKYQGYLFVKPIYDDKEMFFCYRFTTGYAHSSEFILLINKRFDNIQILGYGDYESNRAKLINFFTFYKINENDEFFKKIYNEFMNIYNK